MVLTVASRHKHDCNTRYCSSNYLGTLSFHFPWGTTSARHSHCSVRAASGSCGRWRSGHHQLTWCSPNHLGTRCVQRVCCLAHCWSAMVHGESSSGTRCRHSWRTTITHIFPSCVAAISDAVISAATLVFIYCFTSFGVIAILGGVSRRTVESEIFTQAVRLGNATTATALMQQLPQPLLFSRQSLLALYFSSHVGSRAHLPLHFKSVRLRNYEPNPIIVISHLYSPQSPSSSLRLHLQQPFTDLSWSTVMFRSARGALFLLVHCRRSLCLLNRSSLPHYCSPLPPHASVCLFLC